MSDTFEQEALLAEITKVSWSLAKTTAAYRRALAANEVLSQRIQQLSEQLSEPEPEPEERSTWPSDIETKATDGDG